MPPATVKTRLPYDYLANFLGRSAGSLINLVSLPIYHRLLGESAFGIIAFGISLQAISAYMDLGSGIRINRVLANVNIPFDGPNGKLAVFKRLERQYAALTLGLSLVLVITLGTSFKEIWLLNFTAVAPKNHEPLWMCGVWSALNLPVIIYSGAMAGAGQIKELNVILALGSAARPVAILPAIIFLGGGVGSVFAINILVSLLQLCIMRARIFSCLRQNACVQNTPVVSASCSPVSFIRPDSLTIVSTAWLIIPSIDRLMLPAYVSLEDYGRYALIASLGILPASFAGPLSSALIPAIAEAYSKNDLARVRKLFQQSLRISAMLPLGVLAIMFGFSAEIPALVFGQDAVTAGDQQILRQISLSFGLYSLIVPGYAILVATNQQIRVTTAMLLAAILVPALIAILGSRLGTSSGPIAMSISYVLLVAVVYSICGKLMNYRRLQLIRALLTAASPAAIGLAYSWLKEDPSPLNLGTMPNVVVLATVLGINFTLIFKSRIL